MNKKVLPLSFIFLLCFAICRGLQLIDTTTPYPAYSIQNRLYNPGTIVHTEQRYCIFSCKWDGTLDGTQGECVRDPDNCRFR